VAEPTTKVAHAAPLLLPAIRPLAAAAESMTLDGRAARATETWENSVLIATQDWPDLASRSCHLDQGQLELKA